MTNSTPIDRRFCSPPERNLTSVFMESPKPRMLAISSILEQSRVICQSIAFHQAQINDEVMELLEEADLVARGDEIGWSCPANGRMERTRTESP